MIEPGNIGNIREYNNIYIYIYLKFYYFVNLYIFLNLFTYIYNIYISFHPSHKSNPTKCTRFEEILLWRGRSKSTLLVRKEQNPCEKGSGVRSGIIQMLGAKVACAEVGFFKYVVTVPTEFSRRTRVFHRCLHQS